MSSGIFSWSFELGCAFAQEHVVAFLDMREVSRVGHHNIFFVGGGQRQEKQNAPSK